MPINVTSEIGKLKKVMLHRPGVELEHLVPGELERLLFDDIPYLKTARSEHDLFAKILRDNGAEVVYLENLMAEVLKQKPYLKEIFIRQFIQEGGSTANKFSAQLFDFLMNIEDEKELVLKVMSGVGMNELKSQIIETDEKVLLQSFGFFTPHYIYDTSEEYKVAIHNVRDEM